jgi:hypothetical protein
MALQGCLLAIKTTINKADPISHMFAKRGATFGSSARKVERLFRHSKTASKATKVGASNNSIVS